jgi:leucyl aminopeptidase
MRSSIFPLALLARRAFTATIILVCVCVVSAASQEMVWVTMEKEVFDHLVAKPAILPDAAPPTAVGSHAGVVITQLPAHAVAALSSFTHTTLGRIGGFIVHDSYDEAAAALMAVTRPEKALPVDFQIDEQVLVNALLPMLDKNEIYSTIDHLSTAYINRYYQYTSGQQASLWIRDQWQGYATGRSDVTVSTYDHGFSQPSVILTIDGTTLPSEIIVLGAHIDSAAGAMTTTTPAPGADDDASGVAVLSEIIRVLMNDGLQPDRTVKFMAFAGEEGGLLGSGDIAQDHLDAGANVVGMFQLDMTGYFGSVEDIILVDDYTSPELTTFLADLVEEYQPALQWATTTCGYGCSDHASWSNRGYPASFPLEAKYGQHNPYIHSANDTLANLSTDHALKFAKLGLSFAVETGVADCSPPTIADAGPDRTIDEGDSTTIGTPAQTGHTYLWSPGDATTAEVLVSPTETTVYTVTATNSCGSAQDSVTVTVVPAGQNGPQTAVYDAGLGAPACAIAGSSCDSLALLDGRDHVGPEPNQPNTLDSCTDGTSGTYHSDESNDKIVVSSLDGTDFTEGATVRIDATVWAWSTGSSDYLDLYYAADANSPSWNHITTLTPPDGGAQTLSATYTLPDGTLQAVRASFRYLGAETPCSTGSYDDADDLVFAVKTATSCTTDPECDDGLYCNGVETCNAGTCEAGTPVTCDDGVACTDDSCNEGTDSCDFVTNHGLCDNGLFCDGSETCDAVLGCQAGTAPSCDDGVACTDDSCNEGTDQCDNTPNHGLCDNGLFCDGAETCDPVLACQPGSAPCTGSQTCDEEGDVCVGGGCLHEADFEAGAVGWSQGADTCTAGSFVLGTPDATDWQVGSGAGGSANAFFTGQNPRGNVGKDDVDGGMCEALSPTVNAGAEAAVLVSLDYFHGQRDYGDDPNDGFTIEVLNDGVVVDTLVAIGDVTHNAVWTSVSTTVVNPGNIQLRVRATDATYRGDIVEGGVDNVQICPTTPPR